LSIASKQPVIAAKEQVPEPLPQKKQLEPKIIPTDDKPPHVPKVAQSLSISTMINNKVTSALNYFGNRKSDEDKNDKSDLTKETPQNRHSDETDKRKIKVDNEVKEDPNELLEEDKENEEKDVKEEVSLACNKFQIKLQ